MWSVVQISKFYHVDQKINSRHPNSVQESISRQMNDHKSEICNEENAQEFTNIYIFKFIAFDSHFHLYPNIFFITN